MRNNIFNEDFKEFIAALNAANVEYVLVGGYSVIIHGYSRTTGDMDILVNPTPENYQKVVRAFQIFQMPLFGMTQERFLNLNDFDVFEYGKPPVQIDILTSIKGVSFDDAFASSQFHRIEDNLFVRVIHFNMLVSAKKAAGRPKDLNDLVYLGNTTEEE